MSARYFMIVFLGGREFLSYGSHEGKAGALWIKEHRHAAYVRDVHGIPSCLRAKLQGAAPGGVHVGNVYVRHPLRLTALRRHEPRKWRLALLEHVVGDVTHWHVIDGVAEDAREERQRLLRRLG